MKEQLDFTSNLRKVWAIIGMSYAYFDDSLSDILIIIRGNSFKNKTTVREIYEENKELGKKLILDIFDMTKNYDNFLYRVETLAKEYSYYVDWGKKLIKWYKLSYFIETTKPHQDKEISKLNLKITVGNLEGFNHDVRHMVLPVPEPDEWDNELILDELDMTVELSKNIPQDVVDKIHEMRTLYNSDFIRMSIVAMRIILERALIDFARELKVKFVSKKGESPLYLEPPKVIRDILRKNDLITQKLYAELESLIGSGSSAAHNDPEFSEAEKKAKHIIPISIIDVNFIYDEIEKFKTK